MGTVAFDPEIVAAAVVQPPLRELADRAGRRRRRRNVVATVGLVMIATVLGSAATAAVRHSDRSGDGTGGPEPIRPTLQTDVVVLGPGAAVFVRWSLCAATFSVTTDAGATWTPMRGPVTDHTCPMPSAATSYEVLGLRTYTATVGGSRYGSRDAGLTWQQEPGMRFDAVEALPAGSRLRFVRGPVVQAVDPDDGAVYQLFRSWPLAHLWAVDAAPDGALWAIGSDRAEYPDAGTPSTIRSDDRGRTWHRTGPLPASALDVLVVACSGREAYVLATLQDGRAVVHRTSDGGQTWSTADAPWRAANNATVGADGSLIVSGTVQGGGLAAWSSPDGQTFSAAAPVSVPGAPRGGVVPGVVWVAGADGEARLTTDGRTWQRIPPPG